jgi:hypothetical protein
MGRKLDLEQQLRELESTPQSSRYYHGAGQGFDKPEGDKFDPDGMVGPAYYLTSEPRVADDYALNTARADNVQAMLDGDASRWGQGPVGANLRAVDVPNNLKTFDYDAPIDPKELEFVRNAVQKFDDATGKSGQLVGQFDANVQDATDNAGLYNALTTAMSYVNREQPKTLTNGALAAMGYDGVKYQGGKRIPIRDADGSPVLHDVVAVFPNSLKKIRNAISGTAGGIVAPGFAGDVARGPLAEQAIAAAFGAAAAQEGTDENTTLGERAVRAVLGAEAGVRVRNLARGEGPLKRALGVIGDAGAQEVMPGFGALETATAPKPAGAMPEVDVRGSRMPGLPKQDELLTAPAKRPETTALDRFGTLTYASRLSATSTQIQNLVGNLTHSLGDTFVMKPAEVAADILRSKMTGRERTQFLEEVRPQAQGSVVGAINGLKRVPEILRTGVDPASMSKYEAKGFASGSKLVDAAAEMPLRGLAAADAVSKDAAFASHAAALAMRQARSEGLAGANAAKRADDIYEHLYRYPDILTEARKLADRAVYQEDRPEIKPFLDLKQGKARLLTDFVIPFLKTPYNVVAQGLELNPYQVKKAVDDLRAGRDTDFNRRVAQAFVGTTLTGTGFALAQAGYMTGATPKDTTEKSTQPEGWKPFSVRVPVGDGAVYIPAAVFGHFAIPLGIGAIVADAVDRQKDVGDVGKTVLSIPGNIVKFLGEQTFLQGAQTVGRILDDPERWSEALVESMAAPVMPYSAFQRQVDQALGGAARDPKGAIQALLSSTPVLNDTGVLGVGASETRQTALGDDKRNVSGPAAFVAGSRITAEQDEPTLRVMRAARVAIPKQDATWRGLPLTEKEQRAINARAGELMRETIAPLDSDAEFEALSLERRGTIVERLRDRAFDRARREVMANVDDADLERRKQMKRQSEETRRPVYKMPA